MGSLNQALEALREFVEHPNRRSDIIMQRGIYQHKDQTAIQTVAIDGVVFGYQVKENSPLELNPYFDRYAYCKVAGHSLAELRASGEFKRFYTAMLDAFFEPQQGEIKFRQLSNDCFRLGQRFMVAFPVNTNPDLVSIAGGVDLDSKGRILS